MEAVHNAPQPESECRVAPSWKKSQNFILLCTLKCNYVKDVKYTDLINQTEHQSVKHECSGHKEQGGTMFAYSFW